MSSLNPLFQDLCFDPEEASAVNQAYDLACQTLQNIGQLEVDLGKKIYTGVFGADMEVDILNDGPVTILIDTKDKG